MYLGLIRGEQAVEFIQNVYIVVDVEASDPIPGEFNMLSIGAVVAFDRAILHTKFLDIRSYFSGKEGVDITSVTNYAMFKKYPPRVRHIYNPIDEAVGFPEVFEKPFPGIKERCSCSPTSSRM